LTATLADLFYNAADLVKSKGLTADQLSAWTATLPELKSAGNDNAKLSAGFLAAGDSVMQRLYSHVNQGGFHIAEQIDKNNGQQISAKDLTWSFANILTSLKRRELLTESFEIVNE